MQKLTKNNREYLRIGCPLGKELRITSSYWEKIITIKHPVIKGKEKEVQKTLGSPKIIKISNSDSKVYLYDRKYGKNYMCVVARHQNGKGFIITVYITDKIKEGKLIWTKQEKKN